MMQLPASETTIMGNAEVRMFKLWIVPPKEIIDKPYLSMIRLKAHNGKL